MKETKICEYCKSEFEIKSSGQDANRQRFCSHMCSASWQRKDARILNIKDKECCCCHQIKKSDEFAVRGKNNPKLAAYCKKCLYLFQMRRWNGRKIKAIEYLGGICAECGKSFHPSLYDFHHPNYDKDVDWAKIRLRSWDKIKIELDKCELLCCMCHRFKHVNLELWKPTTKVERKKKEVISKTCVVCGGIFLASKKSDLRRSRKYCSHKCMHESQRVVARPSAEQLQNDFSELKSQLAVARKYNVSDKTISKWRVYYKQT